MTDSKNKKRKRNMNNDSVKNKNVFNFIPRKRTHEELEKLCCDLSVMNNNFSNESFDFKEKIFKSS